MLSNVLIPIPEKELIKRFVDKAITIERLKDYQRKSKLEIDNLFNALIKKSFRSDKLC